MFNRILVCLDGSQLAEGILPYVIEQAKSFNSKVFLLKVNNSFPRISASSAMPGMVSGGTSAGWANKLEELETKSYLDKMANELSNKGLNVEAIITTGAVLDIILKCIKDNAIDLVAMTSHAYKGWKRLFLGSITENILRECKIPLLVLSPFEDHRAVKNQENKVLSSK